LAQDKVWEGRNESLPAIGFALLTSRSSGRLINVRQCGSNIQVANLFVKI